MTRKRPARTPNSDRSDGSEPPAGTPGVQGHAQALRSERAPDLATIYRAHHATIWRSLRGFGVPPHLVDDATQDVFVIVQRRLHVYDGRVPLRRWLLGIARNVAMKARERHARHHARTDALEPHAPPVVRAPQAEDAVAQAEASELVAEFLETLRPDKRAVFTLIDIEGMSAPEVAEVLGIKLNTVYSRLRVARQRFEQAIASKTRRSSWKSNES